MKSLLLGLSIAAFTAGSAAAGGCSWGMAKMSHGEPAEKLAQSHPVKSETVKQYEFAELKDAWVINLLRA